MAGSWLCPRSGSGFRGRFATIVVTKVQSLPSNMTDPQHPLRRILDERIAIIDGAMGTTIRNYGMKEADIRGERFKDAKKDLLNNGDLFTLTRPKMIGDIHRRFLEGGRGHYRDEYVWRDEHFAERVFCRRSARARRTEGSGVLSEDH